MFRFVSHNFVDFSLLPKGVAVCVFSEPDGDVVDLLLVEHGQGVRLVGGLVGAVSDEEGTVLQPRQITGKAESSC